MAEPTRDELLAMLTWVYETSEAAMRTMYSRKDREARDRALSEINHRLKEFVH